MSFRNKCFAAKACAAAFLTACTTQPAPYTPYGPGIPQERIPTEPGDYPYPALPPDAVQATGSSQIAGQWQTPKSPNPQLTVSIDGQRIVANFGCLTKAWTYRFDGARLIVAQSPIISCQRMPTPFESEQFEQIDTADRVYHRGGRGLVFRGSGSQLVLVDR